MNPKDIDFPKLVRVMRKRRGINQTQLAHLLANMGHETHQTTISRIEKGAQELTVSQAIDLDAVLGLGLFNTSDGYERGYRAGIEAGHVRGYRAGIDAARKALEEL